MALMCLSRMGEYNSKNINRNSEYRRTIKYLGIFGGAQGISMFLSLVRNKATSVLLGAAGLGFIALYNRTIQMFSECTNLSLSFSAVRRLSDAYENDDESALQECIRVVRSIAFLTGLAGMLLFFVLSPLISNWIFGDQEYYMKRFLMLSPVVLFMAVSGGELAVMRGTRELNRVAVYTLWSAVSSVVIAVPLYYIRGLGGIFPAIFLISFSQMAGALYLAARKYRYSISPFSFSLLRKGGEMIRLGAGYIYSSILTSCSVWFICKCLSGMANDAVTGYFAATLVLITLLPSILFAALDSDYYPRLSGLFARREERNAMVNGQIEVHLLVQAPLILGFVVMLPEFLPLLYSEEFLPALMMTQVAMLGMLFHTIAYPVSFMPLSGGDSFTFFVQESIYNVAFVAFVVVGYDNWGLSGVGGGMLLLRVLDFVVVYSIARFKYGFLFSRRVLFCTIVQMLLFAAVLCAVLYSGDGVVMWTVGVSAVSFSALISLYVLSKHSNIFNKIYKRLLRKN